MPAPRMFEESTRERAVRQYRDQIEQHAEAKVEARPQVGALFDVNQSGWFTHRGGSRLCGAAGA